MPHYYVRLAAGADLARWRCFLKVHLSSHVARQIFMSGQVPLAVLAAYTAWRGFSSRGQLVGLV